MKNKFGANPHKDEELAKLKYNLELEHGCPCWNIGFGAYFKERLDTNFIWSKLKDVVAAMEEDEIVPVEIKCGEMSCWIYIVRRAGNKVDFLCREDLEEGFAYGGMTASQAEQTITDLHQGLE